MQEQIRKWAAVTQVPACPSMMLPAPPAEGWTRVYTARMSRMLIFVFFRSCRQVRSHQLNFKHFPSCHVLTCLPFDGDPKA